MPGSHTPNSDLSLRRPSETMDIVGKRSVHEKYINHQLFLCVFILFTNLACLLEIILKTNEMKLNKEKNDKTPDCRGTDRPHLRRSAVELGSTGTPLPRRSTEVSTHPGAACEHSKSAVRYSLSNFTCFYA